MDGSASRTVPRPVPRGRRGRCLIAFGSRTVRFRIRRFRAIRSRLSHRLDELSTIQVFQNVQQAKESFDRALAGPTEVAKPLSAADDAILRSVAVQFEKVMASSRIWANITPQFASAFEFRSMSVRDQILARYTEKSGQPI